MKDSMKVPLPVLQALSDPATTDVCINGGRVFADKGDGMTSLESPVGEPVVDAAELKTWILEVLSKAGRSWDARVPFIDAPCQLDGLRLRLHVVFPPISETGLLISIRKLAKWAEHSCDQQSLQNRWSRWRTSERQLSLLIDACRRGESIIVSGATGSGKTTLASDLLSSVPHSQRIIALEDTPELSPGHPHFVSLQSRPPNADGFGEITLRALLRQCLRMRPDRIVLGECRGAEVMELLQALNTGHGGGLATLHANSPRDALRRLETLALLSGTGGMSVPVIREWIAAGVQWVAQVTRTPEGRRITEIAQVCGLEAGVILLRPVDAAPPSVARLQRPLT
jgi:pilus assembly protein CpaF